MRRDEFIFGPYVTRRDDLSRIDHSIENTGCVLEFSTSAEPYSLQIFRTKGALLSPTDLGTYVIRESEMPFGISCLGYQVKDLAGGPYITLSAFLAELYALFPGSRSIKNCITDVAEALNLESGIHVQEGNRDVLHPDLTEDGYSVSSISSDGRRLLVDFSWTTQPGSARRNCLMLLAGGADFRPRPDKSLGPGRWIVLRPHRIEQLLYKELQERSGGTPSGLFTDAGRAILLSKFKWTRLALMTTQEARSARVEFVRQHRDLIHDHKALGKALKDAQLYSEDTGLSQICKFLPSLIRSASV